MKNIKNIIQALFLHIVKIFVSKELIIVRIDGGICSQMVQYAFGQLFSDITDKKGRKAKVVYDISWFNNDGWDLTHTVRRNYDLEKLFPNITVPKASNIEINVYKKFYNPNTRNIDELKKINAPFCLEDYYDAPDSLYKEDLIKLFSFENFKYNENNKKILDIIHSVNNSCAVHIRRGDLANNEKAKEYGYKNGICQDKYFINAIQLIKEKYNETVFFFFSDDIDYVQNNIISQLKDIKYEIVNINSAEDGYLDLFLISNCQNQITSIGSLGIIGYFLNQYKNKILVTNNQYYYNITENVILLDNAGNLISRK